MAALLTASLCLLPPGQLFAVPTMSPVLLLLLGVALLLLLALALRGLLAYARTVHRWQL